MTVILLEGCTSEKQDFIQFYSINEVRNETENLQNIFQDNYDNLTFKDFTIDFPQDRNEFYQISIAESTNEISGKNIVNRVEEQVKQIKDYMGKNLVQDDIQIWIEKKNQEEEILKYGFDTIEKLKGENYSRRLSLVLYDHMEAEEKYMQLSPNYSLVWMSSGGMLKDTNTSISKVLSIAQGEYSHVQIYYRNESDSVLNSGCELNDGNVTIQQGIEKIEKYINQESYNRNNADISLVVDKAYVFPLENKKNGIYFTYRRCFEGIVFDTWHDGRFLPEGSDESEVVYDVAGISIYEKDSIDFFYGSHHSDLVKRRGEAIKKIISLNSACHIVDEAFSKETIVKRIEIAYRVKNKEEEEYGIPMWKFELTEKGTNQDYKFYVNLLDGTTECVEDI